jgi:hypothetical protein
MDEVAVAEVDPDVPRGFIGVEEHQVAGQQVLLVHLQPLPFDNGCPEKHLGS